MPHLSKRWWHPQDTEDPAEAPAYKPMESIDTGEKSGALGLLQDEQAGPDLWRKALETVQCEEKWDFLSALHLDDKNTLECVDAVRKQASQRAEDTRNNERGFRLLGGKTYTYRQVYENIATYANKFQIVGDLLVQADPGYATVPWALVRFGITAAIGESETYHRMLDGTQFAAKLIAQYPVIEKTYARVDSKLSAALRNSLEQFYVVLLRYQIRAIIYFDAGRKVSRTLTGLNPVSADENKKLREAVTDAMTRVDHDIALVHADISQKGISELLAGQSKQLATTMDGILALANSTGSAMRVQQSLLIERFDEADASQNKRMKATVAQIVEQWQGPLGDLMTQLEKEEIAREEEQLVAIRTWLSAAQPEQDHDEARSKRPMHLGDWLLRHAKFVQWRNADRSSILWLYGLPGTGKTNLSWRVINELKNQGSDIGRKQNSTRQDGHSTTFREFHSAAQALVASNSNITVVDHDQEVDLNALALQTQSIEHATEIPGAPTTGALAFFYCSNDKAERGRQEVFSRADPEELLRSIVSQLARSRQDRSIAPALMAKYTGFGPHSDKQRILNYSDCVDVILAIAADVRITIVIDALDECDHGTCLRLIDKLKEIIHRISQNASLNPMKIFIATRSFTAIEHELTPDHALEVTAENNCEDVKKFIDVTSKSEAKTFSAGRLQHN